jgi:predicted kinase
LTTLVVLSGLPGVGKSTIARGLAAAWPMLVLSVDAIESAIALAGVAPSFERGLAAYLVAAEVAECALRPGLDVVIDAVNSVEPARDLWRRLAVEHDADLVIIECRLSDEHVHRDRLARPARGLAIPEPAWADVQARLAEWRPWPEPHLVLDMAVEPPVNVARALAFVATTEAGSARSGMGRS